MKGARQKLAKYQAKRDFRVTPEPPPAPAPVKRAGQALTFMVHKHDATRLHYDLRLEMGGVLASWAIPKGPSYDPQVKRLAVETEDHPLEYGHFEGRIPDGEYGAGDSLIWDRGTYDTVPPGQADAQRKKGHLALELNGEKLKGRWHLVRTRPAGGKAQWLFFKAKDGLENPAFDVVAERPESVQSGKRITRGPVRKYVLASAHPAPTALLDKVWPPMLATLARLDAKLRDYQAEVKYDGYRGLAGISGGKLGFLTRNKLELSGRFPEIAQALSRLKVGEAVIDGEVVAVDAKGISRFQLLMTPDANQEFAAFDLLWLDGQDLRQRPLEERRDLLESVLAGVPSPLRLAERIDGSLEDALAVAKRRGLEGLLAKRRGSPYVGGRSSDWLKLKVVQSQEVAIVGFTPISSGGNEIGALLVAVYDGKQFQFAGKVGTGFAQALRRQLRALLEKDRIPAPAVVGAPRERDAIWVQPKYVAQVTFGEWTRDGRMRHPSFQGLREDKKPEEARREIPQTQSGEKAIVTLTHPDKVLFPKSGLTKQDVFKYFEEVAPVMVPALEGRPIAFEQWPKGIGFPSIFRQHAKGVPPWATTASVKHDGGDVSHLIVDRPETLLWLANQSALTVHIPAARLPTLSEPDWVVFDLDPGEHEWKVVIDVATALRGFLQKLGLESVVKTSGKRGLHVLVPLARGHTHQDAVDFAVAITQTLEKGLPELATTERSISKRRGRLYLDAFQNGFGKTIVAPYAVRAVEGAPVSTPLAWSEVSPKLDPQAFTIKTLRARLDKVGDLFAPALKGAQRLPRLG